MAKGNSSAASNKTVCPISKKDFTDKAKPVLVKISHDGQEVSLALSAREFSTGSFGWGAAGDKINLLVGGVPVKVQAGINLTVVGSKEAK